MAQILQQTVGHVDAGRGHATQRQSERQPRLRTVQPLSQRDIPHAAGLPLLQGHRRITQGASDPDVIARLRAVASQCGTLRHAAHGRDADRQRSARGVATHQLDAVRIGQCDEAVQKSVKPGCIGLRQRQRQRAPPRLRAHRSQIGQIHRQRLPADVGRRGLRRKMHATIQGVGGHYQFLARIEPQHGGIVADAQQHPVTAADASGDALDDVPDQIEFAHAGRPLSAAAPPALPRCAIARQPGPARH